MSLRQKEDQDKDKIKIAQMLKRAQEKIVEPLDLSTTADLDSVNEYANEIVDSDDEDDFWNSIQEMIDKGENLDISVFPKSIQKEFFEYVKGEEWKKEITVWSPWWLMSEKEHKQIIENCIRPLIIEESSQPTFPSIPCILWFIHQHQYQHLLYVPYMLHYQQIIYICIQDVLLNILPILIKLFFQHIEKVVDGIRFFFYNLRHFFHRFLRHIDKTP